MRLSYVHQEGFINYVRYRPLKVTEILGNFLKIVCELLAKVNLKKFRFT
jgi:hypothetical protein